jgi:ketosteroid isomerase-like protein
MTIRDELAAFNEEFAVALEKRGPDRVSRLYTDDAVFLSQGAAMVRGRDEIRELLLRLPPAPERITFEIGEVIEDGDLVIDIGNLLAGGARFGRYVVIYRRQADGTLKLAVDVPLSDH